MWKLPVWTNGRANFRLLTKEPVRRHIIALAATLVVPALLAPAHAHNDVREQIGSVSREIERAEKGPELYLRRGHFYLLHREFQAALADLLNAGRLGAEAGAVALALGQVYLQLGDLERALAHFDRCIDLQPGDMRALDGRGQTRLRAKQFLGAAEDYERLIRLASEQGRPSPQQYLNLARAYSSAGEEYFDAAILALDTGVARLGPVRALQLEAVRIETLRGRFHQAVTRINNMLERSQRTESLLLIRAEIALRAGQWDAAGKDLRSAIAAIDSLPAARRNTRLAQRMRNTAEAQLSQLGRHGPMTEH